ncbi:MAG: GFA family protein [bacterium]|nr:GFA family protein [bacterium]
MKTYPGGCHCGALRFEVEFTPDQAVSCNCSICSKTAALRVFVPAEQFKLLSGDSTLTSYQFNKKAIEHYFCSNCGVTPFSKGALPGTGQMMTAVNLRTLDEFDLSQVQIIEYDGKSL